MPDATVLEHRGRSRSMYSSDLSQNDRQIVLLQKHTFPLPSHEGTSARLICLHPLTPCLQASTPASNHAIDFSKCSHIDRNSTMHKANRTALPHPDGRATGVTSSRRECKVLRRRCTKATPRLPSWNARWIPSGACGSTPFEAIQCYACQIRLG